MRPLPATPIGKMPSSLVFALGDSHAFGERVCSELGINLSPLEERNFPDGEHKMRPLVSVRGRDVHVFASLCSSVTHTVNDSLCKLLFFISTLKTNGASRVTAHAPYLPYSRKERQTKPRDPVTSQYVARLLEAAGTDCLVTLDVHNIAAFQNAYRIQTVHLDTRKLFCDEILRRHESGQLCVMSPDPGGVKRAQLFREMLEARSGREVTFAFAEKRRSAGKMSGSMFAGDASGRTVVIVDDMIASGSTMLKAAQAARQAEARRIILCAAHALFASEADQTMADAEIDEIMVTDSVPPGRLFSQRSLRKTSVISAAQLFASCVRAHEGRAAITEILGDEPENASSASK